jgi:iron complex outermembrane recepter protein
MAYDFGPAKITYTGGYRDVALTGYQPLNGFIPETFSFHNDLGYKTQSHELRVNGESEKLIWQAGLFYGYETQAVRRGLVLPSAKGAFGGQVPFLNFFWRDMESTTTGVFAQATYNISEKLSLTGGLRNTGDKKRRSGADLASAPFGPPSIIRFFYPTVPTSATQAGMKAIVDSTSKWNKLTYLIDLDYKPSANQLIFVKYSTGYKAGGFDNLGAYKPEYLKSFEIGTKNKFVDNKLRLNASFFHYNYEDQQVTVFISTAIGGAIKNAGSTTVNGLEIDGEFLATKADRFRFTVNYLDAKFNDFLADRNRVGVGAENSINLKGNRPVQSPKWTLVGGYNHDFAIGKGKLNVGIQTLFKSEYFISPFNFTMDKQEAYTKTDIFATYTAKGGKWDIGAFVQNIEDNRILSYAGFTGNTINIYNWIFGSPRLFGIQAGYHF